jgi:hypothetical protein
VTQVLFLTFVQNLFTHHQGYQFRGVLSLDDVYLGGIWKCIAVMEATHVGTKGGATPLNTVPRGTGSVREN